MNGFHLELDKAKKEAAKAKEEITERKYFIKLNLNTLNTEINAVSLVDCPCRVVILSQTRMVGG